MGCVVNHTCGFESVSLCTFSEDCGMKLSVSWLLSEDRKYHSWKKEKEINTSKMPTVPLASEQLLYLSSNSKSQVVVVAVLALGQPPALHLCSVCQSSLA